jgi:hypothetical protein
MTLGHCGVIGQDTVFINISVIEILGIEEFIHSPLDVTLSFLYGINFLRFQNEKFMIHNLAHIRGTGGVFERFA